MEPENLHAIEYHLKRILMELAEEAIAEAKEFPFRSETAMYDHFRRVDVSEIRNTIKDGARLLLAIERRKGF